MDDKPINWEQIRTDYTTGFDGLRTIAKRYNVSYEAVAKSSVKDGWAEQRKAHRAKVAEATMSKAVDIEVDRNTRHLEMFDKGMKLLENAIEILNKNIDEFDIRTIKDAMLTMRQIQDGQRLALGLGSDTSKADAQNATAEIIKALGHHIHSETKTDTNNET